MKKSLLACAGAFLCLGTLRAQVSFSNASSLIGTSGLTADHPVAIIDMNGDNLDDLVILHNGKDLFIEFQNAPGQPFTEYEYPGGGGGGPWGGAWGMCGADADNDGYADLLWGGAYDDVKFITTNTVETDYQENILTVPPIFVQGINFADVNFDGNLDAFVCDDDGPARVYLGDGQGGLVDDNLATIPTDLNGGGEDDSGNYGSVFTDIDNDGDIDLYIAKCRQGVTDSMDSRRINQLWISDGNGTWTEEAASWGIASGEQSWIADFGDIDNDGDMDLLMGQHTGEPVEIYINNGNGTFSDITASTGLAGTFSAQVIQGIFEDLDNDGYIDIFITGVNTYLLAINNGNNTFDISAQPTLGCEVNSFAFGDLNDDGFIDMYATPHGYGSWNPSTDDSLYFNNGNGNNYITFTLNGTVSNPDAVGSRVSIYGPWGVQLREVRSGQSYGIQNSLNCHFGLGTETTVDSVVIDWPSGITESYYNVPGNTVHTYTEGGPISVNEITSEGLAFSVFPNPANDQVMITIHGDINTNLDLMIHDISGKQVKTMPGVQVNNVIVKREDLEAGMYLYTFLSGEGVVGSGRFIFR